MDWGSSGLVAAAELGVVSVGGCVVEADGLYGGIYAVFMFVSWLVWRVCVGFGCEEGGVGAVGALF